MQHAFLGGLRVGVVGLLAVIAGCGAETDDTIARAPAAPVTTALIAPPPPTAMSATTAATSETSTPHTVAPVAPAGEVPSRFDCVAYYRPLGNESVEGAQELPVGFDTNDGAGGATAVFDTMTFEAMFAGGDGYESPSLWLAVTSAEGEPLASVLYQLGATDLTRVQFVGGHGFTGLHDVDHEGSELQFWCTAS